MCVRTVFIDVLICSAVKAVCSINLLYFTFPSLEDKSYQAITVLRLTNSKQSPEEAKPKHNPEPTGRSS